VDCSSTVPPFEGKGPFYFCQEHGNPWTLSSTHRGGLACLTLGIGLDKRSELPVVIWEGVAFHSPLPRPPPTHHVCFCFSLFFPLLSWSGEQLTRLGLRRKSLLFFRLLYLSITRPCSLSVFPPSFSLSIFFPAPFPCSLVSSLAPVFSAPCLLLFFSKQAAARYAMAKRWQGTRADKGHSLRRACDCLAVHMESRPGFGLKTHVRSGDGCGPRNARVGFGYWVFGRLADGLVNGLRNCSAPIGEWERNALLQRVFSCAVDCAAHQRLAPCFGGSRFCSVARHCRRRRRAAEAVRIFPSVMPDDDSACDREWEFRWRFLGLRKLATRPLTANSLGRFVATAPGDGCCSFDRAIRNLLAGRAGGQAIIWWVLSHAGPVCFALRFEGLGKNDVSR